MLIYTINVLVEETNGSPYSYNLGVGYRSKEEAEAALKQLQTEILQEGDEEGTQVKITQNDVFKFYVEYEDGETTIYTIEKIRVK